MSNEQGVLQAAAHLVSRFAAHDFDGYFSCFDEKTVFILFGSVAIFSHDVATTLGTNDGDKSFNERETIVFNEVSGKWVGVHEHLSPMPE